MDPEARPESDETALAGYLRKSPELIRDYGTYVLLALAVVFAGLWVYRSRTQSALIEQQAAAQGLYNMVNLVQQAEQLASLAPVMTPTQLQAQQVDLDEQFKQFSPLVADSPVEGAVAHSLRLRGDFTWIMGVMPPPMGEEPATQPTTGPTTEPGDGENVASLLDDPAAPEPPAINAGEPRTPEEWLDEAEAAYQQVLDRFPEQTRDVIASRFGLAAIAEQRGDFEAARQQYQAILDMEGVTEAITSLARERQNLLEHLAGDVRLAPPTTRPAVDPTTPAIPSAPGTPAIDAAAPATQPATQPAPEPSTRPTTSPVG